MSRWVCVLGAGCGLDSEKSYFQTEMKVLGELRLVARRGVRADRGSKDSSPSLSGGSFLLNRLLGYHGNAGVRQRSCK